MNRTISQREARRLRKRVAELEDLDWQRWSSWASDFPGGTHIAAVDVSALPKSISAIETARKLKHAVIALNDGETVRFYALPLADLKV